jgi:RNA polymerase sigma-70 factor (ECF subfamily)
MRAQDDSRLARDKQLVRLACDRRDEADGRRAAADLLGHYRGRVYTWCMRYMADHEQALDMAQEVLLKAYRSLDNYSGRSPFVCWLWAIARNRCLSELRRPNLLYEEGYDGLQSSEPGPDLALEQKLAEESFIDLIRTNLDPVEQQAIRLRCFERMPVAAISLALDIPEATGARAVLQRARRKLRAALAARDHESDGEVS